MRSFVLFEEYGIENCFIELIEAKSCIDKNEKARLEGSYIRTLECVNKNIAGKLLNNIEKIIKRKLKQIRNSFMSRIK